MTSKKKSTTASAQQAPKRGRPPGLSEGSAAHAIASLATGECWSVTICAGIRAKAVTETYAQESRAKLNSLASSYIARAKRATDNQYISTTHVWLADNGMIYATVVVTRAS